MAGSRCAGRAPAEAGQQEDRQFVGLLGVGLYDMGRQMTGSSQRFCCMCWQPLLEIANSSAPGLRVWAERHTWSVPCMNWVPDAQMAWVTGWKGVVGTTAVTAALGSVSWRRLRPPAHPAV